jgi:hypothetical protein
MFRAVQNFFYAHLEDDVGVCADPRASCRDAAQYGVKHVPRPAFVNRIDPDEDAVKSQKLIADFARDVVGICQALGKVGLANSNGSLRPRAIPSTHRVMRRSWTETV